MFRLTLWTKLVLFTTLIVIATCSAQGWLFLQRQAALVTDGLINNGSLLARHLAISTRYSILVDDRVWIREQIAGLLAVEHVAYVLVCSADGRLLGSGGNGVWREVLGDDRGTGLLSPPTVPPPSSGLPARPIVRPLLIEHGIPQFLGSSPSPLTRLLRVGLTRWAAQPAYFDVALPVYSATPVPNDDPALSLTLRETPGTVAEDGAPSPSLYGTVQVGLSDAHTLDLLRSLIGQVLLLTGAIILVGIISVLFLARRISGPIKSLTATASRLVSGDFSVRAAVQSSDEVGELTRMFNEMVASLQRHEQELRELNQTLEARVQARTEELHQANLRLQELDRLKTQLVANASHELRTPLTSMKVYLSNLLNGIGGSITPSQAETLRSLGDNADRLRRLIDDLLDLSRLQAHRLVLKPEPVGLGEIVQEVVATLRHFSARKNLSVRVDLPSSLDPVWGDKDKLRQVFANLLHNAIKFAPSGTEIRLTAEPAAGEVVSVCVADSGCGIPPDELEKIFLPFYRSMNGMRTRGSGLGLAIVKELVELHGGAVRVESTVGKGSRFFVDLPAIARPS